MSFVYVEDDHGNTVLVNSDDVLDEISSEEIRDYLGINYTYEGLTEEVWHGDFDLVKFFGKIRDKNKIQDALKKV